MNCFTKFEETSNSIKKSLKHTNYLLILIIILTQICIALIYYKIGYIKASIVNEPKVQMISVESQKEIGDN